MELLSTYCFLGIVLGAKCVMFAEYIQSLLSWRLMREIDSNQIIKQMSK